MLTDLEIRSAKPAAKPYKLPDADGLHVVVTPSGKKAWRWRRARGGKEIVDTLGHYPAMKLMEARRERDMRKHAAASPALVPACPTITLRDAVKAWHAAQAPLWKPHHAADVLASIEAEVLPTLGDKTLAEIDAPALLDVLRAVQTRGAVELAHRLRQRLAAAWTFAIASGLAQSNVAAGLSAALTPVVRSGRRPAVLTLAEARQVLVAAEATPAHPVTRLALRLLALTALRPGELRLGEWAEVGETEWRVPALRMKHTAARAAAAQDHVVPLASQAVESLDVLRRLTGKGALMFPSWSNARQPLSENALVYLLNRAGLGGRQVPHGWRATFATVMAEAYPADAAILDLMLAHAPKDKVASAHNRAPHAARRRELAQAWADMLLDGLPPPADLLALPRK